MGAQPIVQLKDISKTYHLGEISVQALKNVSLEVNAGEFVALQGPSGSGKSTMLNICGLLDAPDGGEYFFDGKTYGDDSEATMVRRKRIGFVFQNFNLIPVMTAYENVEYPLLLDGLPSDERRKAVEKVLREVGVFEFKDHLPDRLSGGQRQRVAIARALVKKPHLVIADEPTANLDSATAGSIVDLMKALSRDHNTTFIIATHDERMSRHCGRILQLADGRLA
jgi:putative ABC transport system ATP-binding protein